MKSRCQKGSKAVSGKGGFTIVELLAVIVIIGLLAGMILGVARFATFKSDQASALADLEMLKNAIEEHRIQGAGYPIFNPTNAFHRMIPPVGTNAPPRSPPSMQRFIYELRQIHPRLSFEDPWGTNYLYRARDRLRYEVRSSGPDLQEETDDDVY